MTYGLIDYYRDAGVEDIPQRLSNYPMAFRPDPHQVTGLNLALSHPRFGLFDDAGTGKSAIMQAYALYYIGWGNKVLGVMPPLLVEQFAETLQQTYQGVDGDFHVHQLSEGPAGREKLFHTWGLGGWPDLLLMSYEKFAKLHEDLKPHYPVLITDEAQALRGSESNIHARVYNYTKDETETTLLLATGTPFHNTLLDGYALTRLLDRVVYPSMRTYKRRHARTKSFFIRKQVQTRRGPKTKRIRVSEIVGWKNLQALNENLYRHARRVELDEVASLAKPRLVQIPISMSPAHRRLYETMLNERMVEIEGAGEEGESKIISAQQASQLREHLMGVACTPDRYAAKKITNNLLDRASDLVDEIGTEKKVALYCHHQATVEAVADRLEALSPVLVYGGERSSASKNAASVRAFKNDPETRILIAHPQAGGVGLDLQHACHHLIFVEPTPVPGDFHQVVARFQRKGQKHPVLIYVLVVKGTVYPKIVQDMLDKNDLAAKVNVDVTTFRKWLYGELD